MNESESFGCLWDQLSRVIEHEAHDLILNAASNLLALFVGTLRERSCGDSLDHPSFAVLQSRRIDLSQHKSDRIKFRTSELDLPVQRDSFVISNAGQIAIDLVDESAASGRR